MLSYDLKVGYSCNNKCQHCVIADSKDKLLLKKKRANLSTSECLDLIDTACKQEISSIILTGGEITIRKDFGVIVNRCVEHKLLISIQTNGRKLASPNIIDIVKDIDKIRFIIALHGAINITHDLITQINGSFEESCQGIKAMISLGKHVILKVVISKINQNELSNIVSIADELGVQYINFAFPHGQGKARKNFDKIIPTYLSLQDELERTISLAKEKNIRIEFEAIPFCIIPKHLKLVGELQYSRNKTICTQVKEETFDWNEVRVSIKKKGKNCHKCIFDNLCEGPWQEYIKAFGDNELLPIIASNCSPPKNQ